MDEFTPDLFTLEDEEGKEMTFQLLDKMEVDGVVYYALIPIEEEEIINGDGEMVILQEDPDSEEEGMLVTVEDDDLLDSLFEKFMERINDMYEDDLEEDE